MLAKAIGQHHAAEWGATKTEARHADTGLTAVPAHHDMYLGFEASNANGYCTESRWAIQYRSVLILSRAEMAAISSALTGFANRL